MRFALTTLPASLQRHNTTDSLVEPAAMPDQGEHQLKYCHNKHFHRTCLPQNDEPKPIKTGMNVKTISAHKSFCTNKQTEENN